MAQQPLASAGAAIMLAAYRAGIAARGVARLVAIGFDAFGKDTRTGIYEPHRICRSVRIYRFLNQRPSRGVGAEIKTEDEPRWHSRTLRAAVALDRDVVLVNW
jgi:hypothetical protein